jgi:hypothetical protein
MPYLHWETDSNRVQAVQAIKEHQTAADCRRGSVASPAKDEFLIRGYLNSSTDLHLRRTLDQFKHHSINTDKRDRDQVVYRFCKKERKELKIFMVDQMWMWILGDSEWSLSSLPLICASSPSHFDCSQCCDNLKMSKWDLTLTIYADLVFTCFPERWGQPKRDPLNLFDGLIEDINSKTKPPVRSVFELAALITDRCTGTFDRHHWGNEDYLFLEMFELSIGTMVSCQGDGDTPLTSLYTDLIPL